MNSVIKSVLRVALITVLVLLVPFMAMQFTDQVAWSLSDFMIAAVLLLAVGLVYELMVKKVTRLSHRIILGSVLMVIFILVWVELAVGIFGTPFGGN